MQRALNGLLVDWGGVLTGPIHSAISSWATDEDIDIDVYAQVLGQWMGPQVEQEARFNPVHAIERGELTVPDFENRLAEALSARSGRTYEAEGLLERLFEYFEHAHDMTGLVRRAKSAGLRTGLLSNSWGNSYPTDGWTDVFDDLVISGDVGLRKPDPAIYLLASQRLGLPVAECIFIDDTPHNVSAAVDLGMVGIHHRSYEETADELEAMLGLPLR